MIAAVMFTALHRALGLQPQPLTWDMIVRAVQQGVTEQPDLDWKSAGYGSPGNEWDELAKDVAAMANTGGGLIVLGVRDEHNTAAALRLGTPVALSDPEENSYRQQIFSRTHPPVQGVSFDRLRGNDDGEQAVAIHIPASLDAPHLIYKDRQRALFGAPFRDGTGTNWMAERQLEAAYRLRFAARNDQGRDLRALYNDAASSIAWSGVGACIVAVAKPDQSRPPTLRRLDSEQVRSVFDDALILSRSLLNGGNTPSAFTAVDLLNPRPGLRRHSANTLISSVRDEMRLKAALVSLHDDGSLSLAWAVGWYSRDYSPFFTSIYTVPTFTLERTAIDISSLVGAASRTLGMDSGYSVELGVGEPERGVDVLAPGSNGNYDEAVPTQIRRFQPVRLSIPPQPTDGTLLASARDLALDCVTQAGIAQLRVVPPVS
jgi:Putative DNA-binding domain